MVLRNSEYQPAPKCPWRESPRGDPSPPPEERGKARRPPYSAISMETPVSAQKADHLDSDETKSECGQGCGGTLKCGTKVWSAMRPFRSHWMRGARSWSQTSANWFAAMDTGCCVAAWVVGATANLVTNFRGHGLGPGCWVCGAGHGLPLARAPKSPS